MLSCSCFYLVPDSKDAFLHLLDLLRGGIDGKYLAIF